MKGTRPWVLPCILSVFATSIPVAPVMAFLQYHQQAPTLLHPSASSSYCPPLIDQFIIPTTLSSFEFCLYMGKGDGKKKRKKASSSTSASSTTSSPAVSSSTPSPSKATATASSPAAQPMRVTTNSNIPVRHQIRWAKLNKEYRAAQSTGSFRQSNTAKRTAYRRTWDEEEMERKAEERKRKGQDPDWDVILNRTAVSPLVIVDGYNIIYKWSRLKKHMSKGDTARARQLLVDDLENLRVVKGWRMEVVFDGTKKSTVGVLGHGNTDRPTRMDQQSKTSLSKYGVRVVYSGIGQEADAYIEARCAAAKNVTKGTLTGQFIVASDDSMIRLAGQNAGALCMSADRFVSELKALKKAVDYRVEAAMAKVNGQTPHTAAKDRPVRFGRRSVLIEDKRNRTKTKRQQEEEEEYELELNIEVETDENGIPWWAQLPNSTIRYT